VGPGIFLLVLGAVFTFAVRQDTPVLDVHVTGVIFMLAGGLLIYLSSRSRTKERSVVTRDDLSSPERPLHEVHETVVDHEPWRDDEPRGTANP
jgi:hypothetical protein